ncbi:hypothetical protein LIER_33954 [Lithospermum erythrorhizon]|uniref:Uncharacterized protein n=1 Tax=Lithospermum erythrorhizon TaxID=34254 RepID=A0AAV3RY50_LITER
MEQGASSQLGVTTRARSGAHIATSWGILPRDLPKPKAKETTKEKEVGDFSLQSLQPTKEKEKFHESVDKAHESPRSKSHREKSIHQ